MYLLAKRTHSIFKLLHMIYKFELKTNYICPRRDHGIFKQPYCIAYYLFFVKKKKPKIVLRLINKGLNTLV